MISDSGGFLEFLLEQKFVDQMKPSETDSDENSSSCSDRPMKNGEIAESSHDKERGLLHLST